MMGDASAVHPILFFIGLPNANDQKYDRRAKMPKFLPGYWSNYVNEVTSLATCRGLSPTTSPPSPPWTSESRALFSMGKA